MKTSKRCCSSFSLFFAPFSLIFPHLFCLFPAHFSLVLLTFFCEICALQAVLKFNRFDLYTKSDTRPDIPKLWPYYQKLIDRYLPGKLAW